ncbi:hypothetical protein HDU83_009816 [Entophlyctis luteolus]|nr:hypothetical protein HDU83_009816 [Entophlyctis luteolus]KAJ3390175.1 hypothetical protein HDU84_007871 [Entophlyctis sp. JEL0112]
MAPLSDPDNAILLACIAITVATIASCAYRLCNVYSNTSLLLLIANIIYLSNNIITLIYNNYLWLNSPFRYFGVYFALDTSVIIFYYLYIERLCWLLPVNFKSQFRMFMFFCLVVYAGCCISQIVMFAYYGVWTANGGYSSNGEGLFEVKMAVMSVDLIIAFIILLMTIYSVREILGAKEIETTLKHVVVNSSAHKYNIIMTSDAAKFVWVFAVDVYKATGSVNPNIGILPVGNLGFSHIVDAAKISLMTLGLILPAFYKPRHASSSGNNHHSDRKNADGA